MLNLLDATIQIALSEDLAGGDLTSEATVHYNSTCHAEAIAKSSLIVCGFDVFRRSFELVDSTLVVKALVAEGELVSPGTVIWTVEGPTRAVLMGERTALNFTQRMCGIATFSRRCVDALPHGSRTRITDTRKTTPGLRRVERYAVRIGGAHNHRNDLGSAVLIKENHIRAAGGISKAVAAAKQRAPHTSRIEVEVESLHEFELALQSGADIIMLDNFDDAHVAQAIHLNAGKAIIEVSGGITFDRITSLAKLGVDCISMGALTHSASASDISLLIRDDQKA